MRRLLRFILLKPVLWAVARFSSRPNRSKIFTALDKLYHDLPEHPGKKGLVSPCELAGGKFIIFSDQHKGSGIGLAVCRKIMSMHDGFITAEGTPAFGATINCYFPLPKSGQ